MRSNYNSQTSTYGGQLVYNPTFSYGSTVTIPLFIQQIDIPVRKPKITEVNTIPVLDESAVSDWSTHVMFYGSGSLLTTTMSGFMITPTITINHGITGVGYQQLNPLGDPGFYGYSYGDIIWAYLQGKMNQVGNSTFIRTDPSQFYDPFGNVYNTVAIQQFQCDYAVNPTQQTFSMTLYLET